MSEREGPISRQALGAAVTAIRQEAGLTQGVLGQRTGLGQTVVSRIESGTRKLDSIELIDIATACGREVSDVLEQARLLGTGLSPDELGLDLVAYQLSADRPDVAEALVWVRRFLDRLDSLEATVGHS